MDRTDAKVLLSFAFCFSIGAYIWWNQQHASPQAQQQEKPAADGYLWQHMSENEHLFLVEGIRLGYTVAVDDIKESDSDKDLVALMSPTHALSYTFSMPEVEQAVNRIYSNPENAPICWEDAYTLALEDLLKHAPTAAELLAARLNAKEHGCQ